MVLVITYAQRYVNLATNLFFRKLMMTDTYTELEPVSLAKDGKSLVFTYLEKTGEKQEWSMRPLLMVKVKRTDDPGEVRLVKQQENN